MKFEKVKLEGTAEYKYLEISSRYFASREWWLKKHNIDPEKNLILPEH